MKVTIEKIIYPGLSLAKDNGKIIFSDQGLPQEEIDIRITSRKKDYIRAVTNSILKPSAHRTEPKCAHHRVCSDYQYIDYPEQLKIKQDQLKEIFARVSKLQEFSIKKILPCVSPWHYRNKLHLHIIKEGSGFALAYHEPERRDRFVKVEKCFLGTEQTGRFLRRIIKLINQYAIDHLSEIIVREGQDKRLLAGLIGKADSKAQFKKLRPLAGLKEDFPLAGIVYRAERSKNHYLVCGSDHIIDHLRSYKFSYSAGSFFQVNIPMLDKLLSDLIASVPFDRAETLIDLYCGVGLFSVVLHKKTKDVFAVDSSGENIFFLNKNIKENKAENIKAVEADCKAWAANLKNISPGIIIADPPRTGLDNAVIEGIIKSRHEYLAYVSCDPVTLARDLAKLLKAYTLSDVFPYDFFPQTGHIECLAVLKRS